MFYTEHAPHPPLAMHVRCLWAFESSPADGAREIQTVVPDGYPEMVLHYGDRCHEIGAGGILKRQSRFVFAGQLSAALSLQPGAHAGMIGIRLQPAGARAFLGMSMLETTDRRLDLADVWARDSTDLIDATSNANNVDAHLNVVERFLLKKLARTRTKPDAAVSHGVDLLQSAEGGVIDRCAGCALRAFVSPARTPFSRRSRYSAASAREHFSFPARVRFAGTAAIRSLGLCRNRCRLFRPGSHDSRFQTLFRPAATDFLSIARRVFGSHGRERYASDRCTQRSGFVMSDSYNTFW